MILTCGLEVDDDYWNGLLDHLRAFGLSVVESPSLKHIARLEDSGSGEEDKRAHPPSNKKIVVKYNCLHCPHFATLSKSTYGTETKLYCTADLMHEIRSDELKRKLQQDVNGEPIWFPQWCPLESE